METTHSCANFNNSDNSNVVLPSSDPEPVGKETNKSEKLDFEESPAVAPKCSVTPPSNNDDLVTGQLSTNTDADTDKKKAAPRRAMILTGQPMPALPPRPVFPPELEHYQVYGHGYSGTSEYSVHMQAYFSSLRHDYEKQLKDYDTLKTLVQEDTYYTTVEIDQLDALDEDPFTLDSFENLMRLHANKGKDFILARVTTQDPNDSTKHYHSYYGAHQINKVLFRTQPEEGLLHRMKARNPLNNMLVVGDVHYYIVSADDVNAVKPLPALLSSGSSVSSHSSRMSRCSKLAAQAIASQSTSARSSPILNSDISLFSRSSEIESPVSIIPPMMAMSILKADAEDSNINGATIDVEVVNTFAQPRRRGSSSTPSSASSTPTSSQGSFLPGRSSRLRQTIEPDNLGQDDNRSRIGSASMESSSPPEAATGDTVHSPMTPPEHHQRHTPQQQAQSPLFQSLMGGRIRSRSNTVSSAHSDKSTFSAMSGQSHHSHTSKCSTATDATTSAAGATTNSSPSLSPSSFRGRGNRHENDNIPCATYRFRYLASDDDFLLRSVVRQVFKQNALETWDAILFTISNSALREYTSHGDGGAVGDSDGGRGEAVLVPLHLQQNSSLPTASNVASNLESASTDATEIQRQTQTQSQTHTEAHVQTQDIENSPPPGRSATELSHTDPIIAQLASNSESDQANPLDGDPGPAHEISGGNGITNSQARIGMSQSVPSMPTSTATLASRLPATPSRNTSTLALHDSGHSSTVSLPSVDLAASVGDEHGQVILTRERGGGGEEGTHQPGSVASSSIADRESAHYDLHRRRSLGGKKIRRVLSKIFQRN